MDTTFEAFARGLADRYRIEREIGRGGMSIVYLAADLKHGRTVAIKVLKPGIVAAIGSDRFLREIEAAARLAHPHILPLHDSGLVDGQLYYVMPFVTGGSLRERIDAGGPLPLDEALRMAHEIASALGRAHQQGLVHRDVKPENVLLVDGIAQLADFGVAHRFAADAANETVSATLPGDTLGTPRYMAPEQAGGGAIDGRADQYALACVVFEMLAGRAPFDTPNTAELFAQHARDTAPALSTLRAGLPGSIDGVIARALAKKPVDRFASMAAFAEALVVAASGANAPSEARATQEHARLPQPRTRFVGRERELAACVAALEEARLLTISGIGGSGKTRLAIEVARALIPQMPDGVFYADLAPVREPERVVFTVAAALGLRDDGTTPPIDAVKAALEGRRALLVLDNCEHVLETAADLADALLADCDDLAILATSREGLGLAGERIHALRSLAMPPADADLQAVASSEAVQLFLDRARAVDSTFVLDARSAPAVVEICRRLDGIPLAIELAASRLRVLRAGEIVARLDDRFRLLTGGGRASLPRHQTLLATMQWSYDLLEQAEQSLLRRASVFAGGWTLEAIAYVMDDADEFEMIERLDRLADKSLIVVDRSSTTTRYSMLETVRQFGLERLSEAGEADAARTRHLDYFVAFAERAGAVARTVEESAWRQRLRPELENMLAAHAWTESDPAFAERDLRLAGGLLVYAQDLGPQRVTMRLVLEALDRPGGHAPTIERAWALYVAGSVAYFTGRREILPRLAEECTAIAKRLGDPRAEADALMLETWDVFSREDMTRTVDSLERQVEIARRLGDTYRLTRSVASLADIVRYQGDVDRAEALYEEACEAARRAGYRGVLALHRMNLILVALTRNDAPGGLRRWREVLEDVEHTGLRTRIALVDAAAGHAGLLGEWERAARLRGSADAALETAELLREVEDEAAVAPHIARAREALGEEAFETARRAGAGVPVDAALDEIADWIRGLP